MFTECSSTIYAGAFGLAFSRRESFVSDTVLILKDVKCTGCSSGFGGCVNVFFNASTSNTSIIISQSTFTYNSAMRYGGAILIEIDATVSWLLSQSVSIENCTFRQNSATKVNGGAVSFFLGTNSIEGEISMKNCEFSGNRAGGSGGSVMIEYPGFAAREKIAIVSSVFENSSSTTTGGAVMISSFNTLLESSVLFDNVSVVNATSIDIAGIGILALENLTQVEVEIRNTRFIRLSADHSFLKVYTKNATANTVRLSRIEFIDCTEGVNGARVVMSAFLLSTSASFQNNYLTPVNIDYGANRRNIFVQLKGFMLNCSSGYVASSDGLECEGQSLCLKL
jgi:predicted outer membrane repeat protein